MSNFGQSFHQLLLFCVSFCFAKTTFNMFGLFFVVERALNSTKHPSHVAGHVEVMLRSCWQNFAVPK